MIDNTFHDAVCILFSGGSDSSLTAYRAASKFETVHLLTFKHFGHISIENSRRSFSALNAALPGKFIHNIIRIDDTFLRIYNRNYFKNLFKYGTLTLQFTCFACQASFIIHTIIYCLKNGIRYVWDGANTEYEEASPMQIKTVKEQIKKFYADYGITHESPIYEEYETARSDFQLYKLGLREKPNIKDDSVLYKKYQGYCKFMPASTIWLHYKKLCRSFPKDVQKDILQHWNEYMDYFRKLINLEMPKKVI